jgi:ElaA protein
MKLFVRRFAELSPEELYAILKLRVDVFVVEQRCPYPELDGLDQGALHVWLADEQGLAAYLRVLDKGIKDERAAIGRVIAARRRIGLGTRILQAGIRAAKESFGAEGIYLEAQTYARGLYEKQGFRPVSEEFLEDGIPHIKMVLDF